MPRTETLLIVSLCAALNVALGSVVYLLKAPLYVDMIGTLLCCLLLSDDRRRAFLSAAAAGVISFLLGGLLVNPFLPWFSGTVVAVAGFTALFTCNFADTIRNQPVRNLGFLASILGFGIATGLAAAIVSAPVVVYLFGGVTGSGSALLVAFFLKTGHQLMNAALLSGFTAEPVDKTLQLLLAAILYRATPESFIKLIRAGTDRTQHNSLHTRR
jgi:energy-coupling factor transport system substrate-specific component